MAGTSRSQLKQLRADINAALRVVVKKHELVSAKAESCTYNNSEGFAIFSLQLVFKGGVDKEGARYNKHATLLGLPPLGSMFQGEKIVGMNTTCSKVITERDGQRFIWPVVAVKVNAASRVMAVKREEVS